MLRQSGHAILDGARRTPYGKPFVAAPGVNTKGVIPLRLENPKIGWIYDAEVIGDGIAISSPIFWHFVA